MTKEPEFDVQAAHKYFSAECFNRAWDLIEKPDRTAQEDEDMIRLTLASQWHWTQREDCTDTNMSIAYWQTSRIYALLGLADSARRYAQLCLDSSQGDDVLPVYLGYAYEALARAESVAGNRARMQEYLQKARRVADAMPDPDARGQLLDDLATIE